MGEGPVIPAAPTIKPHFTFNQERSGSTIEPLYTARKMRAFSVTESELNMLSVINGIAAACFALGTGLFGLSVDIQKDLLFATELPASATELRDTVRPLLFWLGAVFYAFGAIALVWRHNTLSIIKREASADQKVAQKGFLVRFWPPSITRAS